MTVTTAQIEQAAEARAAWENLELGDGPDRPGRGAMEDVLALVPDNAVFKRAVTLMEERRETMGNRCDTLLNPHLMQVGIARGDAVEMQTIVASYADTLDSLEAVLDSMTQYLEIQVLRLGREVAQNAEDFKRQARVCKMELFGPAEDIENLGDAPAVSDEISLLSNAVERGKRHAAELQMGIGKLMACRTARAEVMRVWPLALLVERALSRIAR